MQCILPEYALTKSGIYKITNCINPKIYVGSAKHLRKRFREHKSFLNSNKHSSPILQHFVNKYGINTLRFELVEIVDDVNKLIEREQYYIDLWKAVDNRFGFNIDPIAGSRLGSKMSDDMRKAQSIRMMGKKIALGHKCTPETRRRMCERTHSPETRALISKHRKGINPWLTRPHPMLGLKGANNPNYRRKVTEEFRRACRWRLRSGSSHPCFGKHLSESQKKMISIQKSIPVDQFDLNKNLIKKWQSTAVAAKELGISRAGIYRNCKGITKSYYNNVWKIEEKEKLAEEVIPCESSC